MLRRETNVDWVGKWFGIVDELQCGDSAFDPAVFVLSNDAALGRFLRADRIARDAIRKLLDDGADEIRCSNGALWIAVEPPKTDGDPEDTDDVELATIVARRHLDALATLQSRIAGAQATQWDPSRDPAMRIERAFYLAFAATLIVGGILFFWTERSTGFPRVLTTDAADLKALAGALVATGLLGGLSWYLLDRTARVHLVMLELVLSFAPGAWFTLRDAAIMYNMRAAQPPSIVYRLVVRDLHVNRGRRSTSYYVTPERWPARGLDDSLRISSSLYSELRVGDCIRVEFRAGSLGDPWLKSFDRIPCDSPEAFAEPTY